MMIEKKMVLMIAVSDDCVQKHARDVARDCGLSEPDISAKLSTADPKFSGVFFSESLPRRELNHHAFVELDMNDPILCGQSFFIFRLIM